MAAKAFPFLLSATTYQAWGTCPASSSQPEQHYTAVLRGKTEVEITADAVKVGFNYHLNNEAFSN